MSYDILFAGQLAPGADQAQVRARLQGLFRLSEEAAARLFSGQPLALKRGLDRAQAERLRQVFLAAGAVARLVEQPASSSPAEVTLRPGRDDSVRPPGASAVTPASVSATATVAPASALAAYPLASPDSPAPLSSSTGPLSSPPLPTSSPPQGVDWSLAVVDDRPLEPAPDHPPLAVDISRLHLVTGQDWSLADCDQPLVPAAVPDISHLRILEQETELSP